MKRCVFFECAVCPMSRDFVCDAGFAGAPLASLDRASASCATPINPGGVCCVMQFFVATLLPKYGFKTGKWASFQRNLNIYGFVRVPPDAPNAGFYINPCVRSPPHRPKADAPIIPHAPTCVRPNATLGRFPDARARAISSSGCAPIAWTTMVVGTRFDSTSPELPGQNSARRRAAATRLKLKVCDLPPPPPPNSRARAPLEGTSSAGARTC
jgi:hypothetical protein